MVTNDEAEEIGLGRRVELPLGAVLDRTDGRRGGQHRRAALRRLDGSRQAGQVRTSKIMEFSTPMTCLEARACRRIIADPACP
ncbi:hypothetical protein [Streptomyces mirabilis]|uniref:hypothetical protein n=1 Tax=Streptomyces mirabilis TaxID=68239 RepID=UPI001160D4B2|nr:hypothetical protein [Streptomyces mirabilis]